MSQKAYFVPCKEVGCPPKYEMDNVIALGTKTPKTLIDLTFLLVYLLELS